MENYIVSARKYRPATFETVVGQQALTTTLRNAIATHKLAHAYLFCGPRGVGKTTCARIFAKTINCLNPLPNGDACDECESCRSFNEQRSYNIHELDAASNNSVDDIRTIIEQVRIPPQIGKYKVYIIDEVHMLSQSAFNAFLKTLEEPPQHTIFILATTEKHKILPTILSRCQIYDFSRITIQDTIDHLAHVATSEGIKAEPEALGVIAQKADGGMRDALSIFDQVASFTGGNITYQATIDNLNVLDYEYYFRLTDLLLQHKVSECLLLLNEVLGKGFDGHHFITGLHEHLRDLLVSRDSSTLALLEVADGTRQRYQEQAMRCRPQFLYQAMKLCNDCDLNYRQSKNKRFYVELTLIQISQLTDEDTESSGRGPTQILKPIFDDRTSQATSGSQAAAPETDHGSTPVANAVPQSDSNASAHAKTPPAAASIPTSTLTANTPLPELVKPQHTKKVKAGQLGVSIKKWSLAETQQSQSTQANTNHISTSAIYEDQEVNASKLAYKWREFAASLPKEDSAYAARLTNIVPRLQTDGITIQAAVENEMVEKDILSIKGRLLNYLRAELKNRQLQIDVFVSEKEVKVRAFSPVERFNYMAEKNEQLKKLKEAFGLELG